MTDNKPGIPSKYFIKCAKCVFLMLIVLFCIHFSYFSLELCHSFLKTDLFLLCFAKTSIRKSILAQLKHAIKSHLLMFLIF